jgi:hypothetical protein
MAEEIRYDVVAVGHSKGLDDTSRALRGVASDADKMGESFKRTTKETFDLDHAIAEAREEIHRIQEEVRRTGDRSLLGDLRRQKKDLADFMALAGKAADSSGSAASKAMDFGGAGIRPRNALIGMLVAGAAAAAPGIGAMLAGVIAGAVGTAGVAGGILMASKDPRVRSAAQDLGRSLAAEFFRGGDAFVEPTISAMHELEDAFRDMKVPEALSVMAPLVDTIAEGFGDLGRRFMPGFNATLGRMGPFAAEAKEGMGELGETLGEFLDNITESRGAVAGLDMAFTLINGTIALLGGTIKVLSDIFMGFVHANEAAFAAMSVFFAAIGQDGLAKASAQMAMAWKDIATNATDVEDPIRNAAGATESFGTAATLAEAATGHLAGALSDAHSKFLDFQGAEIGTRQALFRLKEALDESNGSLSMNSQEGLAARASVLRFAEAARVAAEKKFVETQSVEAANAVYAQHRRELIKTLMDAGRTRKEAERLARQWMAYAQMPDISHTVYITTVRRENDERHRRGERSPTGRASGGDIWPGTWLVGEHRPEVMEIDSSGRGHVYPSVGSYHGSRGGRGGGGGSARPLVIQTGDALAGAVLNLVVREVQRRGGTLAVLGVRE